MIFNTDILRTIIEYDPSFDHKLVSKQFKTICDSIKTYLNIWNLRFDYDPLALEYIDNNILYIQKWGSDNDQNWYRNIMKKPITDIEEIQNPFIDLELILSHEKNMEIFDENFYVNINNIDMYRFFYLMGSSNNVTLLKHLIEDRVDIKETIFVGAITFMNIDILKVLQEHFTKKEEMILILSNTIESYSNPDMRNIIDSMEILNAIIPNTIFPTLYNIQNINYIKGLIALHKEVKDLNFNSVNVSIYFQNMKPFEIFHKEHMDLLVRHRYYNYLFLVSIVKACLEYGFIDIMEYIWINDYDSMPNDIVRFLNKHGIYFMF